MPPAQVLKSFHFMKVFLGDIPGPTLCERCLPTERAVACSLLNAHCLPTERAIACSLLNADLSGDERGRPEEWSYFHSPVLTGLGLASRAVIGDVRPKA